MIIVWSPRAIAHLADLRAYIAHDNPNAAGRIATTLLAAVERLAELPNLGRPGRVTGTRESETHPTPSDLKEKLDRARRQLHGPPR